LAIYIRLAPPPDLVNLNIQPGIKLIEQLASMCSYKPYLTARPSYIAEAFAARQGVELCRDMDLHTLVLEGDAQVPHSSSSEINEWRTRELRSSDL
jgi:hypothetical protein